MATVDKLANDVRLALFARLSMLLMPLVATTGTGILWKLYTSIENVQEVQSQQIIELQKKVDEHQFVIDNGRQSRLEFQSRTESQFSSLNSKIEKMLDGIADVRESVVRVQTIVETRLPQKATELGEKKWPQQ